MKYFWVISTVLLSLAVIDQLHALHELTDLVNTQNQTLTDYWNVIQNCKENQNGSR